MRFIAGEWHTTKPPAGHKAGHSVTRQKVLGMQGLRKQKQYEISINNNKDLNIILFKIKSERTYCIYGIKHYGKPNMSSLQVLPHHNWSTSCTFFTSGRKYVVQTELNKCFFVNKYLSLHSSENKSAHSADDLRKANFKIMTDWTVEQEEHFIFDPSQIPQLTLSTLLFNWISEFSE